jgi:hypothetical protein
MVVTIPRAQVEALEVAPALQQLAFMTEAKEFAERWEGRLTIAFADWDDDPRETAEIPAIRDYFALLNATWPYWLHFSEKTGDTLPHVLRLLCRGRIEQVAPGLVGWAFDDLEEVRRQLLQLFAHQNALYERLGLSEGMNERISEEVAQLLESAFSAGGPRA